MTTTVQCSVDLLAVCAVPVLLSTHCRHTHTRARAPQMPRAACMQEADATRLRECLYKNAVLCAAQSSTSLTFALPLYSAWR